MAFDETGEPTLQSKVEITLDQWLEHDTWYRNSCPHSGQLIKKRLGNISLVGRVRHFITANSASDFPLLLDRVVYNGIHSGDWIAAQDAHQLLGEARRLESITLDSLILQFAHDVIELTQASIATGNPIVF